MSAILCAGCNVIEPWEHRCFGPSCACEECREADRLFGGDSPIDSPDERAAQAQGRE